jgi:hypothetical protein
MILSLSHGQSGSIAVPASPMVVWIFLNECTTLEICTFECDLQLVVPILFQVCRDIHSFGVEHALRLQDHLAIEHHCGISIQAIES